MSFAKIQYLVYNRTNLTGGTGSMDRVADFESVGWGFESLVPHHICC